MNESPRVTLSMFSDEIAAGFESQLVGALSQRVPRISIRSGDPCRTGKSNNIMRWTRHEVETAKRMLDDAGMQVAEFGGPIGKVKLEDVEDGTKNVYVAPDKYLGTVDKALDLTEFFGCKRFRGFTFYHPKGKNPDDYVPQVVDRLGPIVDRCVRRKIVYGAEVEANLVGDSGQRLARIAQQLETAWFRLVFDPANLTCQNLPAETVLQNYLAMRQRIGWFHAKEYRVDPALQWKGHVDEEMLRNFVPFGEGSSDIPTILAAFAEDLPRLTAELAELGIEDGVLLTEEPHEKGGGQFGGYSGPEGMGVHLAATRRHLIAAGIEYSLLEEADVKARRAIRF
ncbi:hypothetical protein A2598_04110 [Candidatus Peribacteria bacterium RIFOXYD1_FULL_54_13]|nr:MAG: hypothetical protein A2598_04110 [Candidatus Peribacteria bacterium RIFOXYD1_FULL_54_13]